jgi:hypothetical protein
MSTLHRRLGYTLVILLLAVVQAAACSVPVFRYALERWPPSNYQLWVFHQGPLDEAQRQLADDLDRLVVQGGQPTNVEIQWADVSGTLSPAAAKAYAEQKPTTFPHATLWFAAHGAASGIAYAGPAEPATLRGLLQSPVRQAVAQRLLGGDSAVWLLVESGTPAKDDRAHTVVSATLTQMATELKLPEHDPKDGDVRLAEGATPLTISFPLLRVSRQDPAERGLIQLLTAAFTPTPPADQPLVVVIAGQGRAIALLSGAEIDPGYLSAWCEFIAGPCSCQVKAELPGSDLLADWSQLKDGRRVEEPEVPNVAVVNDLRTPNQTIVAPPARPQTTTPANEQTPAIGGLTPSQTSTAPTPTTSGERPLVGNLILVAAGALALLVGLSVWLLLRQRGD